MQSPRSRCKPFLVHRKHCLCPHVVEGGRQLSSKLYMRAVMPHVGYLPETLPPNTITGDSAQHRSFRETRTSEHSILPLLIQTLMSFLHIKYIHPTLIAPKVFISSWYQLQSWRLKIFSKWDIHANQETIYPESDCSLALSLGTQTSYVLLVSMVEES